MPYTMGEKTKLTKNMKMEVNEGGYLDYSERLVFHSGVKKSIGVPSSSPRRMKSLCKGELDTLTIENTSSLVSVDTFDCDKDETDHVWDNEACALEICSIDDGSFFSHAIDGQSSYEELQTMVRALHHKLQRSDAKLAKEKARRKSRERNIAKMARELLATKAIMRQQEQQIEEMKEENAQLEQRLEQSAFVEERCERRIRTMNEAHVKQCDLLCREVVEANRENKVLREKADLVFKNKVTAFDITAKTESRVDESSKIKMKGMFNILAFVYAIYAIWFSSDKTPAQRYSFRSRPAIALSGRRTESINRSAQLRSPNDTSFQSVYFATNQGANSTPGQPNRFAQGESSSAPKRPLRTRAKHVGMKLKKAVVTDEGDMMQIPFKNAFLASKQVYDVEEPPTNEGKSPVAGWLGSLKDGVMSFI